MFIKKQVRFIGLIAVCFCISLQATSAEPEEKDFTPDFVAKCKERAEAGDAEGQALYGRALVYGWGVASNHVAAVGWLRKAVDAGNAMAQCDLGVCYKYGKGVKKDEVKAVEWYRKAADQGFGDAQCNLGVCYESGTGVEKDDAKAVEWYRKAADQGFARGQCYLGECYESGTGVEKDKTKAVEWYHKAVEQQYARAERMLSFCYSAGRGVEKDEAKAIDLMQRSADHGDSWARYNLERYSGDYYRLGNLYWNGAPSSGIQRNEDKAIEYWRKAADAGDKHAKKLYDAMEANVGWNAHFDHSSLVPDTKIDSFAGFTFGGGGISEDAAARLGLEKTEDMHLVKKGTKKNPFRKMDGIELFFTPKTRETYGVRLFVKRPYSTFDSWEAAFVECIATRETITRRYGVLPEYQAKDKQNDNVTNGPWRAPSNPVFELPDSFSYKWKLEGVTIVLSIDGRDISLMATDDELAEIAENERKTLLKKARETAAQNDGGDML